MKNKVYMIFVLAMALLIPAASVFAASAKDELASERKMWNTERRIFIDKLATQRESFEEIARRLETKVIQLERDLEHVTNGSDKRIDDLRSHMDKRVDDVSSYMEMIFFLYSAGFAIVLAILGFLGWKTVKEMAEGRIKKLITDDFVKEIIEEKGKPAIDKLVCDLKESGEVKIDEVIKHFQKDGFEKSLNKDKELISENAESIISQETEKSNTYKNWAEKGLQAYSKGMFKDAAESFANASALDKNVSILFNAAISYGKIGAYDLQEISYLKAIDAAPNHADSLCNYANFLKSIRAEYDKAEDIYLKALKSNPKHSNSLGSYALFLETIRKNYDKAEVFYKRALEADLKNATNLGNYALFLKNIRNDYDKAEKHFKIAIKTAPSNDINLGNYALFLHNLRKDYDKAAVFYKKALKIDPNNSNHLGSYALFLHDIHKDYDKAEELYKRVLEIDPRNAIVIGNYAHFLKSFRNDYDNAEKHFKIAIKAAPSNDINLGNYAFFLHSVRKNYDKAEKYYKRALEADPSDGIKLGNYAGLLLARGAKEEGFKKLEDALLFTVNNELLLELMFYSYAHEDDEAVRNHSLKEIKKLISDGDRSDGFDMRPNVERAIADEHPYPELLTDLERVISAGKDAGELEKYEQWKQA